MPESLKSGGHYKAVASSVAVETLVKDFSCNAVTV